MDRIAGIGRWLHRRAENMLALMLGVMFFAFIAQIIFRYFFRLPTGWSSELTVIMWLWMVLWGAAFVVREDEEIRFDILSSAVGPALRRIFTLVTSLVLIGIYLFSLPAIVDYVLFMKVQSTAYLKIRFDYLFSIYIVFVVAVALRYAWLFWDALRLRPDKKADAKADSAQ